MTRLFTTLVALLVTAFTIIATPTPVSAEFQCTKAQSRSTMDVLLEQIEQIDAAATLLDAETFFNVLGALEYSLSLIRSICNQHHYEGEDYNDGEANVRRVDVPEGTYLLNIQSEDEIQVSITVTEGDCEDATYTHSADTLRTYALFISSGCEFTVSIEGAEEWTVFFSALQTD